MSITTETYFYCIKYFNLNIKFWSGVIFMRMIYELCILILVNTNSTLNRV